MTHMYSIISKRMIIIGRKLLTNKNNKLVSLSTSHASDNASLRGCCTAGALTGVGGGARGRGFGEVHQWSTMGSLLMVAPSSSFSESFLDERFLGDQLLVADW